MNEEIKNEIQKLKKEKDAVILAHYYVDGEVQEIADYVGDSYYLAEIATKVPESTIVFCGVSFMGESAKILNPKKRVVMADGHADCPMAHMVDVDKIREVRKEYPDVSVVCYVNSTAEIKAESDVCVTSSNALKIVKNLPNKDIFFIPDENLGRFVASQLPEKHFIFNDGFCHVVFSPVNRLRYIPFSCIHGLGDGAVLRQKAGGVAVQHRADILALVDDLLGVQGAAAHKTPAVGVQPLLEQPHLPHVLAGDRVVAGLPEQNGHD